MKNWRTTVIGILTGLGLIIAQLVALFDNDPATVFSLEGLLAGLAAMGIGYFAKDAGVSGTAKSIIIGLIFLGAFSAPAFALDISKDSSIDGHVMLGRSWDYDRDSERVTVSTERDNLYVEAELGYRYKSVRPFIAYKELHQYRQEKTAGVDLLFYDAPYGVFGVRTSYEYVKTLRVPQRYLFTGVFFKF